MVPLASSARYTTGGAETTCSSCERATGPTHVSPITIEITRTNIPIVKIFFIEGLLYDAGSHNVESDTQRLAVRSR